MLLETIVNATPALNKLMSSDLLPITLAFRLGILVKVIDPILQSYNDRRVKLIKSLSKTDEKGNNQVPKDKMGVFTVELKKVLAEDVKVEGIPDVCLKDLEEIKMTAQDMATLTPWLVKE